jgi:hypothetical protein
MIHKGESYSVKLQKYYFCNGTSNYILNINDLQNRFPHANINNNGTVIKTEN